MLFHLAHSLFKEFGYINEKTILHMDLCFDKMNFCSKSDVHGEPRKKAQIVGSSKVCSYIIMKRNLV